MKMNLKIPERLALLQILPHEGSYAMLHLIRGVADKLVFSAEEKANFEVRTTVTETPEGSMENIVWNDAKAQAGADIEFDDAQFNVIVETLRKMDLRSQLRKEHIGIYERFVMQGGK